MATPSEIVLTYKYLLLTTKNLTSETLKLEGYTAYITRFTNKESKHF